MSEEFVQLKQTKGTFELRGKLFGLKGEKAFKEIMAKNNKPMRMMNLGVRVSPTENVYLSLNATEPEFVYFSKSAGKKGEKPTTEKVEYSKMSRFNKDGYKLIGFGLALHKDEETGKNEDVKVFVPFDAIKEIEENAVDGTSVFVKGTIEFGSFEDTNTKEIKKTQKFVPNAIYLTKEEINFDDEKFEKYAEFVQPVIYRGVNRIQSESGIVTYSLDVASINYKGYEEFSLECSETIAKAFKENKVKPYCKVDVTGKLENDQVVETVDVQNVWGEESKVGKPKNFAKTILMVTGARPETINTEDYNQKIIDTYRQAVEEESKAKKNKEDSFSSQEAGWGSKGNVTSDELPW